ncbi:MAG: T9SS type A sorting domain-containing protein, partial [Flexibacteraceae bacterium]
DAGNFFAPLALPPFTLVTPRIAVNISLPTRDSSVIIGESFPIRVDATDSTNQAIERTILRINGLEVANVLGGSININYRVEILTIDDTLRIQAEAIGALGVSRLSKIVKVKVYPMSVNSLAAMGISVYPNPTSATLTINSKLEMVKSVQIKDVSGKVVYTASPNALQSELNVSELTNGFYLVEIATDKGTSVARIVKQ